MLINFDRRIAEDRLSSYTKVHSLITPVDFVHHCVRVVHGFGKGNGSNMPVLSKIQNMPDDWLGHSPSKVKTTKSRFRNYFGPLVIVGELMKAQIAFNRLLLKCRSWFPLRVYIGLSKLHFPRFLTLGHISKRFLQGLQPVEL